MDPDKNKELIRVLQDHETVSFDDLDRAVVDHRRSPEPELFSSIMGAIGALQDRLRRLRSDARAPYDFVPVDSPEAVLVARVLFDADDPEELAELGPWAWPVNDREAFRDALADEVEITEYVNKGIDGLIPYELEEWLDAEVIVDLAVQRFVRNWIEIEEA